MTVTTARYKLLLASEWLLPQRPLIGCGISTAWHGGAKATNGETTLNGQGRLKDKAQRTADLMKGYRAFTRVADANGIPDTDDYVRIHRAMLPGLPDPERLWTRSWDLVMDHLKANEAVSIALRLSALGPTNPVDFTTADHQVLIWGPSGGDTWVMGPMRKHSNSYSGHRAPLEAIRKAAKAISGGTILTWLYPIGGWTAEALAEEASRERLRALRTERDKLEVKVDRKDERIVRLLARIAELEEGLPACEPEVLEARLDELERLEAHVAQRREELG